MFIVHNIKLNPQFFLYNMITELNKEMITVGFLVKYVLLDFRYFILTYTHFYVEMKPIVTILYTTGILIY